MKPIASGLRSLVLSCSLLAAGMTAPISASANADYSADVKIQINDQLIAFPDAQPYLDGNHRTQVPLRFVSEQLGYQVDWSMKGDQVNVTLTGNNGHSVSFRTGDPVIVVDGKKRLMDTAPFFNNGRVYTPLRFISDAASIRVQWDQTNYIAILNEDGQYHAPAWYAPRMPEMEEIGSFTSTAYSAAPEENGGYAGLDYFGNQLQVGTVAVDPNVIPLGTKLYIEGYRYDGLPQGGMYATATDIGGAIKGKRMDIFIPASPGDIRNFGIQQIKVYKVL